MILNRFLMLWLAVQPGTAVARDLGPTRVGDVVLRLQCNASNGIRFTLANRGMLDTTLWIGAGLGNGSKYMISDLKLAVQASGQPAQIYRYNPHDYPPAIAGRLDDWLLALPARSEFALSARPEDFLSKDRPKSFPKGSALRLTLNVPQPRSQTLMLRYWAGTLTSNTCVVN